MSRVKLPTIFAYWFKQLSAMMPDKIKAYSEWTSPLFIKQQLHDDGKYCVTDGAKNCRQFLAMSLQRAVTALRQRHGSDVRQWQWGRVHSVKFSELGLGGVPYLGKIWQRQIATGGDAFTVNVGTYDFKDFLPDRWGRVSPDCGYG